MHRTLKPQLNKLRADILHLRDVKHLTFPEIGRRLNRDHTTILYHYRKAGGVPREIIYATKDGEPRKRLNHLEALEARVAGYRAKNGKVVTTPAPPKHPRDWVGNIERAVDKLEADLRPKEGEPTPLPKPADKYAYLHEEPVCQGKSYATYRYEGLRRSRKTREAFKAKLREEHKARVARRGKLKTGADGNIFRHPIPPVDKLGIRG